MALTSEILTIDDLFESTLRHLNNLVQQFDEQTHGRFTEALAAVQKLKDTRWAQCKDIISRSPHATEELFSTPTFFKYVIEEYSENFIDESKQDPLLITFEKEYRDGVYAVIENLSNIATKLDELSCAKTDELAKGYEAIIAQHLDELVHEAISDVRTYMNEYMTDGTGEIEYLTQGGVSAQDALNVVKLGWNKIFPRYTIPATVDSEHLVALLDEHWDIVVGEIEHMFSLPVMQSADEHVINIARDKYLKDQRDIDDAALYQALYPMVSRGVLDSMKI